MPISAEWLSAVANERSEALPTVEQLGALFGEILAEHAGSSPCVIAGYSLGGKIAFEAARVLQRAGGNVAFVLLLDAAGIHLEQLHTRAGIGEFGVDLAWPNAAGRTSFVHEWVRREAWRVHGSCCGGCCRGCRAA